MGVKMRELIADQLVARDLHDLVVKFGVEPRESGVARPSPAAVELPHLLGAFSQLTHPRLVDPSRGAAGAVRLQQQAKLIELVETSARDLRRRAVANEM